MKKDHNHMYELCKQHMHSYVLAETADGKTFDGILTGVDDEYAYFAVPMEPHEYQQQMMPDYQRQFGYGYPGYGYGYPGYGYGYGRPPRRFNRLILPLAALVALSTLPWY